MKVAADRDACMGAGVCVGFAPDLFDLGEDGRVRVLNGEVSGELRDQADEAVRVCPASALSLTD
ncbi:ferredoxin [Streptomyces sp. DSM 44917]|uniref:Ferredoxin n=1 Tax=Streptomyces boetiae TaxID=3075541 RepID=A0ABU2L7L5_9ACTN|nr:ferredoxin [Streptomyces sp. DSM 44917]MDT0307551.1 ferredoxin [Streptomyces sp. DSM 44917]